MSIDDQERLRRWRLILGADAGEALDCGLGGADVAMDRALDALYGEDATRKAGLGASAPNVTRWLGDIRTYFPTSVVQVMQQDAFERLGLKQMLLEPELLATVEADVHLVGTLLSLSRVIPEQTKETARMVVRRVVEQIERRIRARTIQAVRGSLNRASRTNRPRPNEINWDRTIRANLKHYQPDRGVIIPERVIGHARKRQSLRDIVLCVDQSGSMASSVVYSSVFAAVLASITAVSLRMVVFDTAVVDLSEELHDPVDLLFGTRLGGGTDINRALAYCQSLIARPAQTILVLITDLYEGGSADAMLKRVAEIVASGAQVICLLALSDSGAPIYHDGHAAALARLGVPTFACTPDLFPDLMATAIARQDVSLWAARHDIALARPA
jgi:Mg-chelatase subunit ChlD